ncbi:hypothetical protein [Parablautia muri]|uniref:hypothetical protein n=1 Tax=Parablautia muri TaxID=2320879 RepID=UPI00136ADF2F|nr:hypothetical protein [Parablautia muri]MDE6974848.1 hypothetical protein [Lachnospiraceae bacterium]
MSINVGKKFWEISRWNKYSNIRKGEGRCIYGIYEKTVANWKKIFIIEHMFEVNG